MASTAAPAHWRSRIVGSEDVAPDRLLANPKNWRLHPKAQQEALAGVLDRVGWVGGVLVNRTTGHLVDGHLRVELALSRGEPTVPVSYVDLSEEEEALVLASLDPLASMAVTDQAKLEELLASVTLDNAALEAHLVTFMAGKKAPGLVDPDQVPEPPEEPYVKPGDLWLLGSHRILCGDATNAEDVDRLMGAARADAVWTDPPYGVEIVGGGHQYSKEERRARGGKVIGNDAAAGLPALLQAAFGQMARVMKAGAAFYVAHAQGRHQGIFLDALPEEVFHLSATLVWVKNSLVLGRADHHYRHEPVFYGWRQGAPHRWYGGTGATSVFEVDRPARSEAHPTMKPVALVEAMLANSTMPGDLVYEPFSGSGTTIIAAETLGRRCYAMELEPRYVQVAIERWQTFTGREAVRG